MQANLKQRNDTLKCYKEKKAVNENLHKIKISFTAGETKTLSDKS